MHKRILYISLILVILILFSGFFWLYETRYLIGRASVTIRDFSVDNSYIFVSPLNARANNEEKIRVTVFVLNNQGLGVFGRRVSLSPDTHITQESIQGLTDALGKAVFDLRASKSGNYFLDVKVDDTLLPQKARLNFF